jgi:biotin transport system substrate-specific component
MGVGGVYPPTPFLERNFQTSEKESIFLNDTVLQNNLNTKKGILKMTTLAPTLYIRTFPRMASWLRDLMLIALGALFVAILAQVKVPLPFTPVPLTGQTFAVLLVAAALGSKRGAASMAFYIALGAFGLPVFAGGAAGMAYFSGATLGYLIGFVIAAYAVGLLAERGLERNIRTSILPFLAGTIIIYVCGVSWLTIVLGSFSKALAAGFIPFVVGDVIKLVAASLALPAAWKLVK